MKHWHGCTFTDTLKVIKEKALLIKGVEFFTLDSFPDWLALCEEDCVEKEGKRACVAFNFCPECGINLIKNC